MNPIPFFSTHDRGGRDRFVRRLAGWLVILLTAALPARALTVNLSGDRMTLRAAGDSLQDVLRALAAQGVAVQVDPDVDFPVKVDVVDRRTRQVLASILKGYGQALVWEPAPGGGRVRLKSLHVFRPGFRDRMRPVAPGDTHQLVRDPRTGALFVRGELLVRIAPDADPRRLESRLARLGARVAGPLPSAGLFRLRLDEGTDMPAAAARIAALPGIDAAEPNFAYSLGQPGATPFPAPLPAVTASDARVAGSAPVAVLDTGLRPGAGLDEALLAGLDAVSPGRPLSDALGHGTQMALIAAGSVTPLGTGGDGEGLNPVIAVRAFDDNGFTSSADLAESIAFALQNGARVMSLSWGSETPSRFLADLLADARARGLIIVASAGNRPTGLPYYPAAYEAVTAVAALNPDGTLWENSNSGDFVAVAAPGLAALPVGYRGDPGLYAGTSIATAFVARQIAAWLSGNPGATAGDALRAITERYPPPE